MHETHLCSSKDATHLKLQHPFMRPRFFSKLLRQRCLIKGHTSGTNARDEGTPLVKVGLATGEQSSADLPNVSKTSCGQVA